MRKKATNESATEIARQLAKLRPDQFDSFDAFQKRQHELLRAYSAAANVEARSADLPGNCAGCAFYNRCPLPGAVKSENRFSFCPRESFKDDTSTLRLNDNANEFLGRVYLN